MSLVKDNVYRAYETADGVIGRAGFDFAQTTPEGHRNECVRWAITVIREGWVRVCACGYNGPETISGTSTRDDEKQGKGTSTSCALRLRDKSRPIGGGNETLTHTHL